MSDNKTLTLRDVPASLVHEARRLTGKGTASQSLIACVPLLTAANERLQDQADQIHRLKIDLQRMHSLMRQLAPLCVQVAEVAGQKDLFD